MNLSPKFGHRWSKSEDYRLQCIVSQYRIKDWDRIAYDHDPIGLSRTSLMCQNRWRYVIEPGILKGSWSKEEDDIIVHCVNQGVSKWSDIAKCLPTPRLGKQCRERWTNHLDPNLKKSDWTLEEDLKLKYLHEIHGNRWTQISLQLHGRSENEIKNRWNSARFKKFLADSKAAVASSVNIASSDNVPSSLDSMPQQPHPKRYKYSHCHFEIPSTTTNTIAATDSEEGDSNSRILLPVFGCDQYRHGHASDSDDLLEISARPLKDLISSHAFATAAGEEDCDDDQLVIEEADAYLMSVLAGLLPASSSSSAKV